MCLLITLGLAIGLTVIIRLNFSVDAPLSWLVAINLVTLVTYGYDKMIAGSKRSRVPENVLLALAFAGGTVGAMGGMQIFRHKTSKRGFRRKFWLVVLFQVLLLIAYLAWGRPLLSGV